MKKISAILIDDEPQARATLRLMLEQYCPRVEIVSEAGTVEEGILEINNWHPELIFLDINIGDKTGFDLLDRLKKRTFDIIFTTAHSEFGVRAIKEDAMDYLVKPIDIDELIAAIGQFVLKKSSVNQSAGENNLLIPTAMGHEVIRVSEVMYLEADNNYTVIHLDNREKIVASKTLKVIEELLGNEFCRVHRSFIVKLSKVKSIGKGRSGNLTLIDDTEILVSRDRKDDLMRRLSEK
jgi:two-component system, LytTR family, response regulator